MATAVVARPVVVARLVARPRDVMSLRRVAVCSPRLRPPFAARAMAGDGEKQYLAPLKPQSPAGEFLSYLLTQDPALFESAVEEQLNRLEAERAAAAQAALPPPAAAATTTPPTDMVLYRRIEQLRASQRRAAVEDLLYACVLHKFFAAGVGLLPPLDGKADLGRADVTALMTKVHSPEAWTMVKEHLTALLGPPPAAFSAVTVRISKLQGAQVYAASMMFGYFVRQAMGTLPGTPGAAASRLEQLFSLDSAPDSSPDSAPAPGAQGGTGGDAEAREGARAALRQYVATFSPETVAATARVVSAEGVSLCERHAGALFGPLQELQAEMERAVGGARTPQELMDKVKAAMMAGTVQTLSLTYGDQRRLVLEAVAFGSFLRDVEANVLLNHSDLLLSAAAQPGSGPRG